MGLVSIPADRQFVHRVDLVWSPWSYGLLGYNKILVESETTTDLSRLFLKVEQYSYLMVRFLEEYAKRSILKIQIEFFLFILKDKVDPEYLSAEVKEF